MADYTQEILDAYMTVKDVGGAIVFSQVVVDDTPTNPLYPWEGNTAEATDFAHFAVFIPLSTIAGASASSPFAESAIIPAYLLPFEVVNGMTFRKELGDTAMAYTVVNTIALRPDGITPIIYTCEVNSWPAT